MSFSGNVEILLNELTEETLAGGETKLEAKLRSVEEQWQPRS